MSFTLPKGALPPRSGVFRGWEPGCELAIAGPFVAITGPSRDRVLAQAARVLRVSCHALVDAQIAAVLESPPPASGRDGWSIIVNADIAFAPTALGVEFPELAVA